MHINNQSKFFRSFYDVEELVRNKNVDFDHKDFYILSRVLSLTMQGKKCYLSNAKFAYYTGISESTIAKRIKKLVDMGIFEKQVFQGMNCLKTRKLIVNMPVLEDLCEKGNLSTFYFLAPSATLTLPFFHLKTSKLQLQPPNKSCSQSSH